MKLQSKLAVALLWCLSAIACNKIEKNIEPEIMTKGSAAPILHGGWRKMGDFLSVRCVPTYLFTLDGKAYFSMSATQKLTSSFWQYDPVTNEFTPKAPLPDKDQSGLPVFKIKAALTAEGKGYVAFFWTDDRVRTMDHKAQAWVYDPASDRWQVKADLFTEQWYAPGVMTINGIAYACGWGTSDGYRNGECYTYDFASDQWNDLHTGISGNAGGTSTTTFALGNKGYMVNKSTMLDSLRTSEYDPAINSWRKVAGFPMQIPKNTGVLGYNYAHYTLGNEAYIYFAGPNLFAPVTDNSIYKFSGTTKQWTRMADFDGPTRIEPVVFAIGDKAYIGFGYGGGQDFTDLWEYNP